MRILTVVNDLERGGTQRAAQTFSLEYARRGHQVAVLAHQGGGVRKQLLEEHGVPVYCPSERESLASTVANSLAFSPEIIHFHREGRFYPAESWLLDKLEAAGLPVIESSHFGYADFSPQARRIGAHLHLSRWCLWRWRQWLGWNKACGVIIPNPVDATRFTRPTENEIQSYREDVLGIPEGAFVCGRVGQAGSLNWHPSMFAAFRDLAEAQPNAYLAVIGLPKECQPEIDALPLSVRRRVIQRQNVDNDRELSLFYASLNIFLHAPVRGETFGLVLAEAMLCGTPVITVNTPHAGNSQADVVGHLKGGYVALSSQWLSKALRRSHDNPEELAELSSKCRELIVSRFCVEQVAPKVLRIMTYFLESRDKSEARRRIQEDEELQTEINAKSLQQLLYSGIGQPSTKELSKMRLFCNPLIYRAYALKRTTRLKSQECFKYLSRRNDHAS